MFKSLEKFPLKLRLKNVKDRIRKFSLMHHKKGNSLKLLKKSISIRPRPYRHRRVTLRKLKNTLNRLKAKLEQQTNSDVTLGTTPSTSKAFDNSQKTRKKFIILLKTCNAVIVIKGRIVIKDAMKQKLLKKVTSYSENKRKEEKCFEVKQKDVTTLMDDLMSWKYFKIKPCDIQCYLVTQPTHPQMVNGTLWADFKYEILRLRSFCHYPTNATKSALVLARDGFVYIGSGSDDKVMCFSCCVVKIKWLEAEDVSFVHCTMSPQCHMVTGNNSGNISINASNMDFNAILININSLSSTQDEKNMLHIETDSAPFVSQENTVKTNDLNSDKYNRSQGASNALQSDNISSMSNTLQSEINHTNQDRKPVPHSSLRDQGQSTSALSRSATNATLPTANTLQTVSSTEPNQQVQASVSNTPVPSVSNNRAEAQTNAVANQPAATGTNKPNAQQSYAGKSKDGKGPTYSELGIVTERPKRTEYALKIERLKTFANWSRSHHIKSDDLADAGFYYAGYGDCARCFFCGGGLRNWEDEDDVWVEHSRWFPKCAFIRQLMGQNFVDAVQELNKTKDKITFNMVVDQMGTSASAFLLDSKKNPLRRDPAVQAMLKIFKDEPLILEVAASLKSKDGIISADLLLMKLKEETKDNGKFKNFNMKSLEGSTLPEDEEAIRQIKERNNVLRQQTMCKICMDKDVEVVFLPCGHLVSCAECAGALADCPVCRKQVKGTVRAFIS